MDIVCDDYFSTIDALESQLESFEDLQDAQSSSAYISGILNFKKQLILLRRNIRTFKDAVHLLTKSQSPPVLEENLLFYRDLNDHLLQILDSLEMMLMSSDSLVSLALNVASNQMNMVMKVLTIIATIFIPLTFIAGVYGMNFHHMPELDVGWAYPAVLGIMVIIGIIMLIIFKRKKWF